MVKKIILQEKADMSFEEIVSSLELKEEEVSRSGKTGSMGGRNKMNCYICNKPGHKMYDCYYNPKSKHYKPSLKPTLEIKENLKRRKLWYIAEGK